MLMCIIVHKYKGSKQRHVHLDYASNIVIWYWLHTLNWKYTENHCQLCIIYEFSEEYSAVRLSIWQPEVVSLLPLLSIQPNAQLKWLIGECMLLWNESTVIPAGN